MIREELENFLDCIFKVYHATYDFKYEVRYPVMINDDEITIIISDVASSIAGEGKVFQMPQWKECEGFGYYLKKTKGSFII